MVEAAKMFLLIGKDQIVITLTAMFHNLQEMAIGHSLAGQHRKQQQVLHIHKVQALSQIT